MSGGISRRTPDNPIRENDFVTMAQCAKIAMGAANIAVANALAQYEAERQAAVWYHRWWRSLTRRQRSA